MARSSKASLHLWFVVTLMTSRVTLGEGSDQDLDQSTVDLSSETKHWGVEPGDTAPSFRVPTLDGELSYSPGALHGALIIHAFTHKSGFLECLWNNESSLSALVLDLPDSTQVLFLSLDDSAVDDALWMRRQVQRAALQHGREEVLSRLHFSPLPVFALGNWIPAVLYSWVCTRPRCGLAQAAFTSEVWKMPLIVKRLDARYDWLDNWDSGSYHLVDAGEGCEPSDRVAGRVAWVSEGNCSFFTKVQSMAQSNASGVLVWASEGRPLQNMNCQGEEECSTKLPDVPASMVHREASVIEALGLGQVVNVSFQGTPSPLIFIAIDQQGVLSEMGGFLYPSFSFLNWQAQWFEFSEDLRTRLLAPAQVVPVFDRVVMHGHKGAVATVEISPDMLLSDTLELDVALSCPGRRDMSCAHWDHTVQLLVCCDPLGPYCNVELGRWISAFRRGTGHWLTDVSPLIPLLGAGRCTFTMKHPWWAMPWVVSLNLRFRPPQSPVTGEGGEQSFPFWVMPLYGGGVFDKNYNTGRQPITIPIPDSTKKVLLYAVITAHGSDDHRCGEFCVTSHTFPVNGINNSLEFSDAGSPLGCTRRVREGAVPNEYGTWLSGRAGWCCGLPVRPWVTDVTGQLDLSGQLSNRILYYGLFEGRDPNPTKDPGYIIMSSFLVYYR
ncbi:uncharacterized protein si:dkey-256h2.1 isoform X1 [Gadus morhua]|uniref:Si:dkey-256h2.1 n=1 Tax=Gadus morhua TaxID=8049 RepID=A0A8C5F5L4_GADMO|nr:uncharacterized protein LOC115553262 isoform X1 [Gadus morhua]